MLILSFKSLYMVSLQAKKLRQLRVSRFKSLPIKETRYYMQRVVSLSLLTVTILALHAMDQANVWLVIASLNLVCFWTTDASQNAPVTILLKSTCAKDVILTVWSAPMEAPDAQSATMEHIFRGILVSSSAELAVNSKMKLHSLVTPARHPVLHALNRLSFVIHACRLWQRSSSIWTSVWLNAQLK